MCKPVSVQDNDTFAKLWLHECSRVFADRLCTQEDHTFFQEQMLDLLGTKFKVRWNKKDEVFAEDKEPIFSVILKLEQEVTLYELVEKKERLLGTLEDKLTDYNFSSPNKMDLVFFNDAVKHVCSITRILMQPRGNAMLIGVSGCGKQSLTKLSANMLEHLCFSIKLSKNFKPVDFRDTIRERMVEAGCDAKGTTFILTDT